MLLKIRKLKKAQSTAEYSILFALVVAAALGMQTYMKRSVQAKLHDAGVALTSVSDDITGDRDILGTTRQYEPYYAATKQSTTTKDTTRSYSLDKELEGGSREKLTEQVVDVGVNTSELTHVIDIGEVEE